jgi:hypothetical protein
MTIEAATYLIELDATLPASDDFVSEGDDHLRLIKEVLGTTFPVADKAFYFPKAYTITASGSLTVGQTNALISVDATSGEITLTLPASGSLRAGDAYTIIKTDTSDNLVKVKPATSKIQQQANVVLVGRWQMVHFVWTGTAWCCDQRSFIRWLNAALITADTTLDYASFGRLLMCGHATDNITIILPNLTNFEGAVIGFKHAGGDNTTVTLDGSSSQKIDGANTFNMTAAGQVLWLAAIAGQWETIDFSFTGFAPNQSNTWTEVQIFVGASLVEYEQTLNFAASIAWDMSAGNHAKVTLTGNCTFANPTGKNVGQRGLLRIIADGNIASIAWNSIFEWLTVEPTSLSDGSFKIFEYFIAASNLIYIWQVAKGGGSYTEYDLGTLAPSTTYTKAHGLGQYPTAVDAYFECTSASNGFAVGDRILVDKDSGDAARGSSLIVNATNVILQTGSSGQAAYPPGSGSNTVLTAANFKVIMRVFN